MMVLLFGYIGAVVVGCVMGEIVYQFLIKPGREK